MIEGVLQPSKSKPSKGGVLQLLESKSTATTISNCFFFHMSLSNSMFSNSLV